MWWQEAVIYELYIDRFATNLQGVIAKLQYLKDLGINTLWILPHYPTPGVDGGYDISDYKNVHPPFGSLEDFKVLTSAAHEQGMRVVIDLVLNHTSDQHEWFKSARESTTSPYRDYYLWNQNTESLSQSANAFPQIKFSNWIYNDPTRDYYFATFYPQQPDLNWDNPGVFNEFTTIMDFWIAMGVDGFRLDAITHLIKREGTDSRNQSEVHQILKRLRKWLESVHPEVILLAEASGPLDQVQEYFGEGDECHLAYHFELTARLFQAFATDDFEQVTSLIPTGCFWVSILRNHDALSFRELPEHERKQMLDYYDPERIYEFYPGRSTAQRLLSLLKNNASVLRAYEKMLSLPGPCVVYYGDEIGMPNASFTTPPVDTREYVRAPFDWTAAQQQQEDSNSLYKSLQQLIKLRNENIEL